MAIARRTNKQSGNSGTLGTNTSVLVGIPTDAVAGDVMITVINAVDNALTTAPAITQASMTSIGSGVAGYLKMQAFYKVLNAADITAGSFTYTFDRASVYEYACFAYSGVDTSTPVPAFAFKATPNSTLSPVTDSATPSSVNDWIVAGFCDRTTTSAQKTTGWAATAPLVEQAEQNNNTKASSPWSSLELGDDGAVVGSVSAQTRTSTRSGITTANANWQGVILVLKAASASAVSDVMRANRAFKALIVR